MNEKIFVGNVKTVEAKFGTITKLGFKESDLELLQQHVSNGWVNVAIMTSQKTGNPYMVVDTYKPKHGVDKDKIEQQGIEEEVIIPGEEETF